MAPSDPSAALPSTSQGSSAEAGAGPVTAAGAPGQPRDQTPVVVGFELIKGGNEFIGAAFGTPINFGDGRTEVMAVVKDINARGGVGGRKIQPVFAEWNAAGGDPAREQDCAKLIDDGKAQFIVTVINISSTFVACAAKRGVPVINSSLGAGDEQLYRDFGKFFFSPGMVNLDRESKLLLESLAARKLISPKEKVGVVIDGRDPMYQRVFKNTEEPTLKRLKIPYISYTVINEGDVNNAVLRFSSENVKQVVFIAPNGIIEILFMQAAEQQRFRPMYGMGDSSSAWFVSSTAPREQVRGIQGVGSLPLANVAAPQYPTTPREQRCLDLIRKEGENNADRHSSITATVYCEATYAFAHVGALVQGKLTADAFAAAYPTAGKTYLPLTTFATDLSRGNDSATQYRTLGWSDDCTCVRYLSGPMPIR